MAVDRSVGHNGDLAGDHGLRERAVAHRLAGRPNGVEVLLDGGHRLDPVGGGRRLRRARRREILVGGSSIVVTHRRPSAPLPTTTAGTISSPAEPGRNGTQPMATGPAPGPVHVAAALVDVLDRREAGRTFVDGAPAPRHPGRRCPTPLRTNRKPSARAMSLRSSSRTAPSAGRVTARISDHACRRRAG